MKEKQQGILFIILAGFFFASMSLGQYKWYYLQGQRAAMELHPEMQWQFL